MRARCAHQRKLSIRKPLFGCKARSNCVPGEMEYVRPMPRHRALQGSSSFINLFLERDARPGHDTNVPAKTLIQIEPAEHAVTEKV